MTHPLRTRIFTWTGVAALAVGGYFAWQHVNAPGTDPASQTAMAPPLTPAPPAPVAEPPAAVTPAIQHPMEPLADPSAPPLPALGESEPTVTGRLTELLGRQNVLVFLQPGSFVRHAVATVDNLGRDHAPSQVWPINPTPGRFSTFTAADGTQTVHRDNSQRYAPLVTMVEAVDTAQAVALYRTLYPLFQQAHEELGFPGRHFNDRLVAVMDLLISTPTPIALPTVTRVDVKGPVASLRPWVRYEYANPDWQALSSGQKILLRVGPENQRRLVAKLRDIRQHIAKAP